MAVPPLLAGPDPHDVPECNQVVYNFLNPEDRFRRPVRVCAFITCTVEVGVLLWVLVTIGRLRCWRNTKFTKVMLSIILVLELIVVFQLILFLCA